MRKLLAAGSQVFATKGYHATRVDDIVKLAETSHGTFYLYFSNKEDLFRALAAEVTEAMHDVAESLGPLEPGAGRAGRAPRVDRRALRPLRRTTDPSSGRGPRPRSAAPSSAASAPTCSPSSPASCTSASPRSPRPTSTRESRRSRSSPCSSACTTTRCPARSTSSTTRWSTRSRASSRTQLFGANELVGGRRVAEDARLQVAELADRPRVRDLALHEHDRVVGDPERMVHVLFDDQQRGAGVADRDRACGTPRRR